MKVEVELADSTRDILSFWARLNGKTLEEHLAELLKADARLTLKALEGDELDEFLGLQSLTVKVAFHQSA
jgi:hypothetical protein